MEDQERRKKGIEGGERKLEERRKRMRQLRKTDDGEGYCDSLDQGRMELDPVLATHL